MAETQSSTRTPGSQGTQAPHQGRHDTAGQHEPVQEIGKELRAQAQTLMTQGQAVAAEYYEEGRNQVLAWQQQLENQVRQKPLQAVCIAAGIGLLCALLRRR